MLLQDWLDIDFAIKEQVDFIAVSFVKTSDVINNLKSYVESRSARVSTCMSSSKFSQSGTSKPGQTLTCAHSICPAASVWQLTTWAVAAGTCRSQQQGPAYAVAIGAC